MPSDPAATLRALVTALIAKIDAAHGSASYKAMVSIAYVHGHRYDGPTYHEELAAVKAALSAAPARETPECEWREDKDHVWSTECGDTWVFTEGPVDMKFCHRCGSSVRRHEYDTP